MPGDRVERVVFVNHHHPVVISDSEKLIHPFTLLVFRDVVKNAGRKRKIETAIPKRQR